MKFIKKWKYKIVGWALLAMLSFCELGGYVYVLAAKSPTAEEVFNTVTSSVVHVNQSTGYISKITVGTTANTLWSSFAEKDYVVIYDKKGNIVSGSTLVGTGMTVALVDEGTITKKYTIVVTGDTSGDGKINITDMIAVKAATLKKSGLSGSYEKAGDVNGDGKINITDFIKVKATTLKKDTITGVVVK